MAAERLQKLLARAGVASRRAAEALIEAGRVTVDGEVAHLGQRADLETQRVEVDSRPLAPTSGPVTLLLHKPAGILVTASDEHGRRTVFDLLQRALDEVPPGLTYVGRLDRDSEGLLLLTTDGELAHRLAHPRFDMPRTYEVSVAHLPDPAVLRSLRAGIELEDGRTRPAQVEVRAGESGTVLEITLHEGRKREVRRMFTAVGHPVQRLVRTSFGPLRLGGLERGAVRPLTSDERQAVYASVGLEAQGASSVDEASLGGAPLDAAAIAPVASDDPQTQETPSMPDAPLASDPIARSVAMDGPTASGKSVAGRALAKRLGCGFFDTGLMYRACTLAALNHGIDPADTEAVIALVLALDLDVTWPEPARPLVRLEGADVSGGLRTPEIEANVSLVSRIPEVRDELVRRQREFAAREPVVMVGRDIGTRVLTEARAKLFLEASPEVRARRRLGEELNEGRQTSFEQVLAETRRRDELDATGHRAIRREQAAPDALVIDTDAYGIEEVVTLCVEHYQAMNPLDTEPANEAS